jgi:hypothetical protein
MEGVLCIVFEIKIDFLRFTVASKNKVMEYLLIKVDHIFRWIKNNPNIDP